MKKFVALVLVVIPSAAFAGDDLCGIQADAREVIARCENNWPEPGPYSQNMAALYRELHVIADRDRKEWCFSLSSTREAQSVSVTLSAERGEVQPRDVDAKTLREIREQVPGFKLKDYDTTLHHPGMQGLVLVSKDRTKALLLTSFARNLIAASFTCNR